MQGPYHTYSSFFKPLLEFDKSREVFSLIRKEESAYFFRFWKNSSLKDQRKEFKHLFQNLRKNLDACLEDARYNHLKLKSLQNAVSPIFKGTLFILEERLEEKELLTTKVKKAFNEFKSLMERTLKTPSIRELKEGSFEEYTIFPCIALTSKTNRFFKSIKGHKEKETDFFQKIDGENEEIRQAALHFTPLWGENWEDKLSAYFKKLQNDTELSLFTKMLEPIQIFSLVNRFYEDLDYKLKLARLLLSLRDDLFLEVTLGIEEKIHSLNHLILDLKMDSPEWVDKELAKLCGSLIASYNKTSALVDKLCEKFREDLKGHHISGNDLREIYDLQSKVKVKIEAIKITQVLLRGLISHPETKHIFLIDLINTYLHLERRLTERSVQEEHGGSIFSIICRNTFARVGSEDEEEAKETDAIEIFGDWTLYHPKQYFEVGLFGDINIGMLHLKEKTPKTRLFNIAKENLAFLKILSVFDLTKFDIFNKTLLKDYLYLGHTQRILGINTRIKLLSDDTKVMDIFEKWDMETVEVCFNFGLLEPIEGIDFKKKPDAYFRILYENLSLLKLETLEDLRKSNIWDLKLLSSKAINSSI